MLDESRFAFFACKMMLKLLNVLGFQSLQIQLKTMRVDLRYHNIFKAAIRVEVGGRVIFVKL